MAKRVSFLTRTLALELEGLGYSNLNEFYFDTIRLKVADLSGIRKLAEDRGINFRYSDGQYIGMTLDQTTTQQDVLNILSLFNEAEGMDVVIATFYRKEGNLDNFPSFVT